MSRAIVKNKYPKKLGKGKLYDKAINTKLEKRIQQIAKSEIDKNKKQKLVMRVLFGRYKEPIISAASAAGEDNKYEEAYMYAPQYVTCDYLKATVGAPYGEETTVRRSFFTFPQTRMTPEVQPGPDLINYKKYGTNKNVCYSDYDEIGHTRGSDTIILKGFRIQGEFIKNPANKSAEVEVSLAVYKVNAEYQMNQRTAQYMLPSNNQAQCIPKRLISEYLGSDVNNNEPLTPDTEDIKSRVLFKKWIFGVKQELYLAADAALLTYNEKKINFSLYCETNQKIEYARGFTSSAGGMKKSNIAMNTQVGGTEIMDKYEGIKYILVIKSNVCQANQALHAPKLTMNIINYWTDVVS